MSDVIEKSQHESPKLYICSTPIGNLSDVSQRLIDTLRNVDVVLCEDTRHTRKLLTHFDIHPPRLVSYHQHNEHTRQEWMTELWSEGRTMALVSDAGTPLLSDPGALLVDTAIAAGVEVIPIPGPSALLAGLVGSGLAMTPFVYLGFPPRQLGAKHTWIGAYRELPATLVMYEAPHRLVAALAFLLETLGDKQAVLAKELTKRYESFRRGTLSELLEYSHSVEPRGEYVVIVDNRDTVSDVALLQTAFDDAVEHVQNALANGTRHKEAVQGAVAKYSVNRRDLYNATIPTER